MKQGQQSIVIYQSGDTVTLNIKLLGETLWLSLDQIADLFARDKSVISRHLKNIFDTGELTRDATVANFATVQIEGGRTVERAIEHYNLDAIISVGYRVNSIRGTHFRKWSSQVLKDHLTKGYTVNQQRLDQKSSIELKQVIDLLSKTMISQNLVTEAGVDVLQIIKEYTKTWDVLLRFDEDRLTNGEAEKSIHMFAYEDAIEAVSSLKKELRVSGFFGQERGQSLMGVLGNLDQTFDGKALYPNVRTKAAHLLYFVIKDHPFSDGNKRIGCLFFLMYLKKSGLNLKSVGNNALIALALLIAESEVSQKNIMISLVTCLLDE